MVLFFDLQDDYKYQPPEIKIPIRFRVLNRSPKSYLLTFRMRFSTSMGVKVVEEFKETATKKILPGDDYEAETQLIVDKKGKHWILLTGSFSTTNKDRTFQIKLPFQAK
ncbi:MAG: hypothetical protein HWN66_01035 [Candidatus Helarchaeota archaeon]|nr:hypothetical protein [Candidatus Helarchaeota archaeon]